MRRWATVVALLALAGGLGAACGGGDSSDGATTASTGQAPAATVPTAPAPGDAAPLLADGGWSVVPGSIVIEEDFVDDFDGMMRVRNGTGTPATGVFTLLVFKDGRRVARMRGFTAGSVEPGSAQTITLISIHDYVPGPYTFDFTSDQTVPGRRAPGRTTG